MSNWQEQQKRVATGVTDGSRKTHQTEALKLALEALEVCEQHGYIPVRSTRDAITAIKEVLAQPEQEPVAWIDEFGNTTFNKERGITPLYTTPPQRTWVGLTDDEMRLIDPDGFEDNLPQMIQQALKEKNT